MGTLTFNEISHCGRQIFIIDVVFITLDILFLAIRFWSARIARRKLSLDDLAVVVAFAMMSVLSGSGYWGIFNGLGKHITTLTPDQLTIQVKYWDPKPTGWCRDTVISDSATVAGNLLLDIFVLGLPLPVLWRLQMSVRDKITVTAMFSIGIVTVALVLWRLGVTTATRASADWTATLCQVGLIAELELHLGILAVCIPTYGPFFNAYIKPLLRKAGVVASASASGSGGKRSYLNTFGSSGKVKRSQGYTDFADSVDQIVSNDDNSVGLTPIGEGKVVSECTSKPPNGPGHGRGEIHVQRDIEAVYHAKKGGYSEA
ncbi:hypothetical protein FHL15_000470 [Xylaria flabelliformis]|uniref:Rhodopsin domain-containing protein n=1 Tax=Xylaria flabelliformis TaxID=2512241 RepID=A0A553IDW9_9PEZI|nr:hypothetical protein FHL15_000470 [Xylaria flabelliformis]